MFLCVLCFNWLCINFYIKIYVTEQSSLFSRKLNIIISKISIILIFIQPVYHIDREEVSSTDIDVLNIHDNNTTCEEPRSKTLDEDIINLTETYKRQQGNNIKSCLNKYKYIITDSNKVSTLNNVLFLISNVYLEVMQKSNVKKSVLSI